MSAAEESAPKARVSPGDVIAGKYRVEAQLGEGGMGLVFLATHIALGQRVAVKLLTADRQDDAAADRFAREAQIAAELTCEQVPRVVDFGSLPDGASYMVMEFLEGVDLDRLLEQRGRLPSEEAVDLVLQACVAVAEAHARGVVHRDLKPGNVFLTLRPDGSPLVKVLDFGISKRTLPGANVRLTTTGSAIGSPLYMSPEQCRDTKTVDVRSDIWSLGTVLFELVTGAPAFGGTSVHESVSKIAADPPPTLGSLGVIDVPPALEAVIARCLAKRREDRFQTVAELAVALSPLASPAAQAYAARVCGSLERSGSAPSLRLTHAGPSFALPVPPPSSARGRGGARTETAWQTSAGARASRVGLLLAIGGVLGALAIIGVAWRVSHARRVAAPNASEVPAELPSAEPPPAEPPPAEPPLVELPSAEPPLVELPPLELPPGAPGDPPSEPATVTRRDAKPSPTAPTGSATPPGRPRPRPPAYKGVNPGSPPALDDPSLRSR